MPELPEVETVVRDLRPHLAGRTIAGVSAGKLKLRRPWNTEWSNRVVSCEFQTIDRRGKWIVISLNRGALLVHLGMTGQLTIHSPSEPVKDHTHLTFELSGERELRYCDIRRFGSVQWFENRNSVLEVVEGKLGPEPFHMSPIEFQQAVRSSERPIKAILLDQSVIAGVGNIYADESLFRAGIRPGTPGRRLNKARCELLLKAVVEVLTIAIEHRGSTIRNYVGGSGLLGGFQDEFAVYSRTGQPCLVCKTPITNIRLAGRSTHYCNKCQH